MKLKLFDNNRKNDLLNLIHQNNEKHQLQKVNLCELNQYLEKTYEENILKEDQKKFMTEKFEEFYKILSKEINYFYFIEIFSIFLGLFDYKNYGEECKLISFGSYANGFSLNGSDIDTAIITNSAFG